MMSSKVQLTSFLFLWLMTASLAANAQMMWPDGKKAAIVLTYDDGLDSHLNVTIPQLNSFGFKGTFFLYGHLPEERFSDWKHASDQGHEIGNHSLFHPCKGKVPSSGSPRFYSENYDVPSMLREITMMNKLIFAITGKKPVSYAYPCSKTEVGGLDYSDSLHASGLVKYARTGGKRTIITDAEKLNEYKVESYSVTPGSTSSELIEYAEEIMENDGLGIYIFHDIGGDYLRIDSHVHQELLKFLAECEDEIWIASFGEVMQFIENKRK